MKALLLAATMTVMFSLLGVSSAFATGINEDVDDRDCLMIGQACLTPDMYKEESPNIMVDSHIQGSDTIKIFGEVNNKVHPIVVQVFAPNGNLITIDQVMAGSDGSFASTIKAGGPLWQQDGAYSVVVQQNIRNSASYVPPTAKSYIATNDPTINTHARLAETEQSVQSATVDRVSNQMIQNRETITITVLDGSIQDFFNEYFDNLVWSVSGGGYVAEITPSVDSNSIVINLIPADLSSGTASTYTGEFASDTETVAESAWKRDTVGIFEISLPREVIDSKTCYDTQWIRDFEDPASCKEWGPDSEYIVLVDGEESDFQEWPTAAQRKLEIPFTHGVTTIEIIGTEVIPEFGTIAGLVLAAALISIIAVSAKTRLNVIPKF
jgi:predicted secreted protein with PEFG-CTERM motif